jgi:hypothetical protein
VYLLAELARLGLGAYQVRRCFFAVLRGPAQLSQVDIKVFLEVRIGEKLENLGAVKLSLSLANGALQDVIVFSHVVSLDELLSSAAAVRQATYD